MVKSRVFLATVSCVALMSAGASRARTPDKAVGDPVIGHGTAHRTKAAPPGAARPQIRAQSAPAAIALESVNVTAQRKTERLQDVPVSVTAISSKDLDTFQIRTTKDVAQVTPNMSGTNNPGIGTAASYFIRGLGSTGSIATFDPAVGTYIDDVYIPRQNANDFGFFDVSQIQVLRGPQGTLFGSNTTGGAIVINMKQPSYTRQGYGEVGYGPYGGVQGRGSIDLPISSRIMTKTSIFGLSNDGWGRSIVTNEHINQAHNVGVREAVRVLVNDDITWDLTGSWIRDNVSALPTAELGGKRISYSGFSSSGGALAPYIVGDKGMNGQGNVTQSWLATSKISLIKNWGRIDFITGYQGLNQNYALDLFGSSYRTGGFTLDNYGRNNTVSQEIKFSSKIGHNLTYSMGLYYSHENNMTDYAQISTGAAGLHPGAVGNPSLLDDGVLNNLTESYALYGQADYKITPKLTATLGGRYTIQTKKFNYNSNDNPLLMAADFITMKQIIAAGISDREKTTLPSFHAALTYRFNPNLMAYVSATEGFKSGGWNAFGSTPASFTRFGPEKAWSVEGGLRSNFWHDRVRLNVTAYWMYDKGFQTTADTVLSNGSASFLTGNFSDLENYGLEADGAVQVLRDLSIQADIGLQRAWYTNLDGSIKSQLASCRAGVASACGASIITPGGSIAEPQFTPAFSSSIGYNWTIWKNDKYHVINRGDVNLVSRELVALAGISSGVDKFRAVMDMGLTVEPVQGPWSLTAECKNCSFVQYSVYGLGAVRYLNAPGYWDLRLSYRF